MLKALAIGLALIAQSADHDDYRPYLMPEVVVTATRLSMPADASPWPVEVLQAGETQITDLADLLSKSICADVRSYGYEGHSAFPILGGILASRVLVLSDGVHMNSRRDGVIDLSLIPVMPGDRIEVVKGPLSALYGSSAIGGVVNVIPSGKDRLAGSFETTDQLGINTGVSAAHNFGIFGARASGSYLTNPGFRANDQVTRFNGKGQLWVNPVEPLFIKLGAGYVHRNLGVPGALPDTTDTAFVIPTFGDSTVTSLYDNQTDDIASGNLNVNVMFLDNLSASVNLFAVNQDFTYNFKYLGYNPDFTTYTTEEADDYNDIRMGADLQVNAGVGEHLILAGGISAVSERFEGIQVAADSNTSTVIKDTTWEAEDLQLGAWLEGIGNIGKFTPSLAVRLDNSSSYGTFISPGGGLAVELIPKVLDISAAYGQSFRAPTFNDLYWPADAYSRSDSTLVPERGQSAALTVNVNPVAFLDLTVVGSWKLVKDMISWNPDSAGFWKPFNVDQVTILGGEFSAGWHLSDGLFSGSLGLAYNHATETREILTYSGYDAEWNPVIEKDTVTRKAAFVPPVLIKGNLAARAWEGGKIAANLMWSGQRINYYADWSTAPDIGIIEKTIEPSLKIDVSVTQRLFKYTTVEAGVRNILDDQTPAHFGGVTDLDYPSAPRRFYGSLNIHY